MDKGFAIISEFDKDRFKDGVPFEYEGKVYMLTAIVNPAICFISGHLSVFKDEDTCLGFYELRSPIKTGNEEK